MGVGMGCAVVVVMLYLGWELWGIPLVYAIAAQLSLIVLGGLAFARQFGLIKP